MPASCFLGLAGLGISGFYFYCQRSLLALYYGQISRFVALEGAEKIQSIVGDSDAWYNWRFYHIGFGCLFLAFLALALACLSSKWDFLRVWEWPVDTGMVIACIVGTAFFVKAYATHGDDDMPLVAQCKSMFGRKQR